MEASISILEEDEVDNRASLAVAAGNTALQGSSAEAVDDEFKELFSKEEVKILELLRDGTRVVSLAKNARITVEDSRGYRNLLLRKFGLDTATTSLDRLIYMAVINGVVATDTETIPLPDTISDIELESFKFGAEGLSSAEIGKKLGVAPSTIKARRATAAKKLNPNKERYGNAALAVKYGIISVLPIQDRIAFAEETRQRSAEQSSLFERVRPLTIDELTEGWEEIVRPDGQVFRKRIMLTTTEYRAKHEEASRREALQQADIRLGNLDSFVDLVGEDQFLDQAEAAQANY